MEYLKKIIEKDLKNMTETEREIYRKASLLTFQNLTEELISRSESFEEKILESIKTKEEDITIYTALILKEKYYLYEEELFPIINNNRNFKNIFESKWEKVLETVFIKKSYSELQQINGRELTGVLKVGKEEHLIKVRLEFDDRYRKKIRELYSVFILNGLKWRTVNISYVEKIFKVVAVDYDENLLYINSDDYVLDINYEDLEDSVYKNYELVWNIEEKEVIGDSMVRPTEDRIYHEHKIKFEHINEAYLYPSSDNIFLTYKDDEFMHIITDDIKENKWIIWKIKKLTDKKKYKELEIPLIGNEKEYNFLNKLRSNSDMRIRTEAEIERIAASFLDTAKALRYKDYYIVEKELENTINTYDMNSFIIDEFKLKGKKEKLYIYFQILENHYLTEDIVSFLISEIQFYFPEYDCIGVEYGRKI